MEQVANDGANAVETDDEVVDETSIIWKNTKDPKVHYHRIKNEWAIVGQAKGIKQILFECGLWDSSMTV